MIDLTQDGRILKAFERGIKEATILDSKDLEGLREARKHAKFESFVKKPINYGDMTEYFNHYYLFTSENLYNIFLEEIKPKIESGIAKDIHDEIGLLLGFPPQACKEFQARIKENRRKEPNIFVDFQGLFFASYHSTLTKDIDWLLKNKPIYMDEYIILESNKDKFIICTSRANWKEQLYMAVKFMEEGRENKK